MSPLVELEQLPNSFLLEAHHYTDPRWEAIEQARIFQDSWVYVGDRAQLSPGQVWSLTVAGRSIVITCTADGQVRGFYNLCAHLAFELCPQAGIQSVNQLSCPNHVWVYGLDGQCIEAPEQEHFGEGVNGQDYALQPLRLEVWSDFLFVCFAEQGPSLAEYLGCIVGRVGAHRQENTQLLFSRSQQVACNWKTYHDRALCDDRRAVTQQACCGGSDLLTCHRIPETLENPGYQFGFYTNLLCTPVTADWQTANRILPGLPDGGRDHWLTYGIFPNLHLIAVPNGLLAWTRIDPLTPEACRVTLEVYGLPGGEFAQGFEALIDEDMAFVETVQRGYGNGQHRPGPVNQLEARVIHQQQLIAGRLGKAPW